MTGTERCPVAECRNPARPGEECASHQATRADRERRVLQWWDEAEAHDVTDPTCSHRMVGERENEFAACPVCREDGIPRDPSQISAPVDVVPADRASEVSAHSVEET